MDSEELLTRYFSGSSTGSEKTELFQAIGKDQSLREEFTRLQETVSMISMMESPQDQHYAEESLHKLKRIHSAGKVRARVLRFISVAAALALIAGSWFISKETAQKEILAENSTWIEAPEGQRVSITLADGTHVALNPSSRMRLPSFFGDDERVVELEGEGYFDVFHDEKRPFIVKTDKYNIQVLGTEFNVFAYPDCNDFEVDLIKGQLYVYQKDKIDSGIRMDSNEKVVEKSGHLEKMQSDFAQKEVMEKGIYDFSGIPLGTLLERLELWYNVNITVEDPSILEQVYIGKFRQSDDVVDILNAIKMVGKFNFRQESDKEFVIF